MKTKGFISTFLLLLLSSSIQAQDESANAEQLEYERWAQTLWASIEQRQGNIKLAGDVAELNVPESFYYLNKGDSKKVLEEIWGNPPGSADRLLGMLFPTGTSAFDSDAWGVTIEYEQDGYVSDEDADEIDYNSLLSQMKEDTAQANKARLEQGYDEISLVGWASPPYYDQASNKLHWAKELQFGRAEVNTLNYNIRVLGRKGVLVLNFIAGIDQLDEINTNLDAVLAMSEFTEGSRYADFDPDIDQVAAYGLGALVAGKLVAKTGLLAAAFIFLKKFGIIILIAIGAFIKKVFMGKKAKDSSVD